MISECHFSTFTSLQLKNMEKHILFLVFLTIYTQSYGIPIDEMISMAAESPSAFDMVSDESSEEVTVELDIKMKIKDLLDMKKESETGLKKRKAERLERRRWTNKVVPFQYATSFGGNDQAQINLALNDWNNYTCLNFRPARSTDTNRIEFDGNGSGCSSFVGMIGGTQRVSLANGCRFRRIVVHELGHAVGFQHEQSRPDRDGFVQIVSANVPDALLFNFEKLPVSRVNTFNVPYDYRSVMHYSARAFSTNGMITVRTNDPNFQDIIGNSPGLSFRDIKAANLMYNCNENCPTQLNCPGEGFQGDDCRCHCPSGNPSNPVTLCQDTIATTTTTTESPSVVTTTTQGPDTGDECMDMNQNCDYWANKGECTRFEAYMTMYCPKACGVCDAEPDSCQDMSMHCGFLKGYGFCTQFLAQFMRSNCKRTCEFCDPEVGNEASATGSGVGIVSSSIVLIVGAMFLTTLFRSSD